jgi:hypothetical protein
MPKQKGTHRIRGSMGDLTYYKDQDGEYRVKGKPLTLPIFED